jgi:single-strand DNA-binding protein
MPSLNKVLLMGHLTRDPELRVTPKGTAICQFGLAINRQWKTEAGEKQEEVLFVDLEAWGKTGETIAKYLHKGRGIYVEGRLKLDQWEDKNTKEKRSKMKVVVDSFQFLGEAKQGNSEGKPATDSAPPDRSPPPPKKEGPAPGPDDSAFALKKDRDLDEDVPF